MSISRIEIAKLHGDRSFDVRMVDNTLILVGENGQGKTSILRLLYYFLSEQWKELARYRFELLAVTISGVRHEIRHEDFVRRIHKVDHAYLRHVPIEIRHRLLNLLNAEGGWVITPEIESICRHYDIPIIDIVSSQWEKSSSLAGGDLPNKEVMDKIRKALNAQVLYLPTYRRIEQELSSIFHGLDQSELRSRRDALSARSRGIGFIELIEFGMKDVERDISRTMGELAAFARESLNNLTFGYLADIVEQKYEKVQLDRIKAVSDDEIDGILNRIHEQVLSSQNKQHVREIIGTVRISGENSDYTNVICHYFSKLMELHRQLVGREKKIAKFSSVCNEYLQDKEFEYDTSKFRLTLVPKDNSRRSEEIALHHLSSGEKQIVSLFSHLYLSGTDRYFVIIDEPELSLSVTWQKRFLIDIREGDLCSGLVAATHSPFIYLNKLGPYARGINEFLVGREEVR